MEPLKNLLNETAAKRIATALRRSWPEFPQARFFKGLRQELEPLELKPRMIVLTERLEANLPKDPEESFPLLVGALKTGDDDTIGLSGFAVWPLTHFVSSYGLDHFALSMATLEKMTQVFTAEFAVRAFFLHHEEKTLKHFESWVTHPNEHVRRLVSEGSRPLLPWAERLPSFVRDPQKTWALLEALRHDPAEYVRKSVANHINDHSKNHGDWVVDQITNWLKPGAPSKEMNWIIRHATRTLVKKGHPKALELHGISAGRVKLVSRKVLTPKVHLGGTLGVHVKIKNLAATRTRVILDHELTLLGAKGRARAKVFKGAKLELAPHETRSLELRVPIRPVTVRSYYDGEQSWAPLINGVRAKPLPFELRSGKAKRN